MSVIFWWKSLNRWRWRFIFSEIFVIHRSRFLVHEIAQKNIHKIYYIITKKNNAIWIYIAQKEVLLFCFSENSFGSFISDSIALNCIKFCMQYTYFATWHWYNFCEPSLLSGAVASIFRKIFGKSHILYFYKSHKNLYARCTILEIIYIYIYFRCMYVI